MKRIPTQTLKLGSAKMLASLFILLISLNLKAQTTTSTLSLGNIVWNDQNNDGIKQVAENGIAGVTVKLYADANNDNVADAGAINTIMSNASGFYSFSNLNEGNYIVGIMIPAGYNSSTVNAGDPDNNIDSDDNGQVFMGGSEIRGLSISLAAFTEPDGTNINTNTNATYDFGLYQLNPFNPICNSLATTSGGSTVQFIGVTYSGTGTNIKSTYTYTVTSGCSPNISHFDFGGLECLTCMNSSSDFFSVSASGTYSFGTDPNTGICGIKYDYDIACNSSKTVSFTLNGYYGLGSIKFALKAGQNLEYADICGPDCTQPILSLGNFVWYDINNNGIQDAGEPGINGATVKLYADANGDNIPDGIAVQTTITNSTGLYNFTNLLPGNYIVGVIFLSGYTASATTATSATPNNDVNTDNNGIITVLGELRSNFITITTYGEPTTDGDGSNGNLTLDFGLKGTGSIGDFVFNDINGNGIQDAADVAISGATVTLTYPNGTIVTTMTNANGLYTFSNLAPGIYNVAFTTPTGFTATAPNVGVDDTKDSDPIGGIVSVTLNANQNNITIDAGFYQAVNLGNTVWNDQNNDGLKQITEGGISSVTVKLYLDANNDNVADGAAVATTTTNVSGAYNFIGLAPGNYIVGVAIPAGYAAVTTNGGDPDNNVDNDNNGTNTSVAGEVRSSAITLAAGTEPTTDGDGANGNLTVDFALRGTGSIGDFVWYDSNRDGMQTTGEPGISGATVTLTYPNGGTLTTTTNASGIYNFPNLAPGMYSLAFTTPTGNVPTASNVMTAGATDLNDSDPIGGVVSGIILAAGEVNNTVDAGFNNNCSNNLIGNVWHDINGMDNGFVDSVGSYTSQPIPTGLRVSLVSLVTGKVVRTGLVSGLGTYQISNVSPGGYYIVLSTSAGIVGQNPPNATLPNGWINTGEKVGLTAGRDLVVNGIVNVTINYECVYNINFAIKFNNGDVGID